MLRHKAHSLLTHTTCCSSHKNRACFELTLKLVVAVLCLHAGVDAFISPSIYFFELRITWWIPDLFYTMNIYNILRRRVVITELKPPASVRIVFVVLLNCT